MLHGRVPGRARRRRRRLCCGRYAGTNPGEFFAVATEAFFTMPLPMRDAKPALYDVLAGYYRQDPAARLQAFLQTRAEQAAHAAAARRG